MLGNTVAVATLPGSYLRSPTNADIPTVMILSEGDRPLKYLQN
ncbi:hypothetical protein [Microcoleus sp. POL10_C6]